MFSKKIPEHMSYLGMRDMGHVTKNRLVSRAMQLVGMVGVIGLLLVSLNVASKFASKQTVDCASFVEKYSMKVEGQAQCQRRGIVWQDDYVLFRTDPGGAKNALTFVPSSPRASLFQFNAANDGYTAFKVLDASSGETVASNSGIVSTWTSNARSDYTVKIPEGHKGVVVQQQSSPPGTLLIGGFRVAELDASEAPATLLATGILDGDSGTSYLLLGFIIAACLGLIFAVNVHGRRAIPYALSLILLLLTFHSGTPYGTQVGWIDSGDDMSYLSWALAIGYDKNPDLKQSDIKSWAKDHNWHPWGTGILLSPGLMLHKLVSPASAQRGNVAYSILAYTAMALTFLSIGIYYFAFRHLFSAEVSFLVSILTLLTTSLLKWTYLRQVFSHAPEAFTIACLTYFFIKRYFAKDYRLRHLLGMMFFIFLTIQIRRENIGLVGLPIYFELLRFGKAGIKSALALLSGAVVGNLTLYATNLLTNAPSLFYTPNSSFFSLGKISEQISKNFVDVFFGFEFGLFAPWAVHAFVAVLGLWIVRRHVASWLPMVGMVAFYLFMCMTFDFPNGLEWQNRFLLKLNPILFGGVAIALSSPKLAKARPLILLGLVTEVVYQVFFQYPANIPGKFPTYRDLFTDLQIFQPEDIASGKMLYYLPLICLSLASIFTYLYAFKSFKRSRS